MPKPTYVLGINDGIVATACLLADGAVVACVSEERLSRQKNQAGLPVRAIQWCMETAGITGRDLAAVATASATMPPFFFEEGDAAQRRQFHAAVALDRWLIRHPAFNPLERRLYDVAAPRAGRAIVAQRTKVLANLLTLPADRIWSFDHHLSHGAAALWASPFVRQGREVLVLTCDGEGDGLSATVSHYRQGAWTRLASTHLADSLGHFYSAITQLLGMQPHDHEYKVMGLAPYAAPAEREAVARRLRTLFMVRDDLTLHSSVHMRACLPVLRKMLRGVRFDVVAGAAQTVLEAVLLEWAQRAIAKTGLTTLAVGGGVFMNVKANLLLAELPSVRQLFAMPSPGDESTALGAAYLAYQRLHPGAAIAPIQDLFWGPTVAPRAIEQVVATAARDGLQVTRPTALNDELVELLLQGEVVARVAGAMEWGARALGHRSLLADAAHPTVVHTLNHAIKQRDFWMPFAPVILDTAQADYLAAPDPAKVNSDTMMVAFRATAQAQRDLRAGMHPYDRTLRAQVVTPLWDPDYYEIVQRFGERTGRRGLINTSFNIHGEPMVCSAEDALSTLQRSGLRYLALGPYLVAKRGAPAAGPRPANAVAEAGVPA